MNTNPYFAKGTPPWLCATGGWGRVLVIKPKRRAKGKELGWRRGKEKGWSSRLVYKMQTAQLAGRTELLSKPLHYVNCLMTQITTLHTSTRSAMKTHILSVPRPSIPTPHRHRRRRVIPRHLLRRLRLDRKQHIPPSGITWENTQGPNWVMPRN